MPTESHPKPGYTDPAVLAERSLYMRLWVSLRNGDPYYPEQFCAGIELIAGRGHAEPVARGWRMTELGRAYWRDPDTNPDPTDAEREYKRRWYEKKKSRG